MKAIPAIEALMNERCWASEAPTGGYYAMLGSTNLNLEGGFPRKPFATADDAISCANRIMVRTAEKMVYQLLGENGNYNGIQAKE